MTATPDTDDTDANPATARKAIRDGIDNARSQVNEVAHGALTRTKDGLEQARGAVSDAYANSRDRATEAYAAARAKARDASHSAAEGLDHNPIAALLGGLAVGAAIGALLPRTQREAKALGAVGEKLHGAAREATEAAKAASRDKLAELGLSRDNARNTMKSLLDGVIAAAGSAGSAMVETARKASADAAGSKPGEPRS
jgi:ElaB/YqjD/DUF883 family membrane-anchored ribosome-binding protein